MKKIILQAADPSMPIKTYKIRTTEMETFHECSYKYKQQWLWFVPTEHVIDIFEQWDELHQVLQAYCVDPQRAEDMLGQIIKKKRHAVDLKRLIAAWNAAKPHIDKKRAECNVLYIEKKTNVLVIDGNRYIFLSGTIDVVREDGEIWDFKSASAEWKPEEVSGKLQRQLYPFFQAVYTDKKEIEWKFVYFVVTKHKKGPRVQLLPTQTTYDVSEALITNTLNEFISASDTDTWQPQRGSHCFKCSLKYAGTCPLRAKEEPQEVEEDRF